MVSVLESRWSAPGSRPGRGHCVVFLGKTPYSHSTLILSPPRARLFKAWIMLSSG